jgi:hypothetical protein
MILVYEDKCTNKRFLKDTNYSNIGINTFIHSKFDPVFFDQSNLLQIKAVTKLHCSCKNLFVHCPNEIVLGKIIPLFFPKLIRHYAGNISSYTINMEGF